MQLGVLPPQELTGAALGSSVSDCASLVSGECTKDPCPCPDDSEDACSCQTGDSEDSYEFPDGVDSELGDDEESFSTTEPEESTPYPHIFAIGDAADAFGSIKAGHCAYFQGEVAARNVLKLAERDEALERGEELPEAVDLEHYQPHPPAIKVSLGRVSDVNMRPRDC